MLAFRASGSSWAIPLADVIEILDSSLVVRLPLLPPSAPGIIDVRGCAVPAVDIAPGADAPHTMRRTAILTGRGERRIALLVDAIDDIVFGVPPDSTPIDVALLLEEWAEERQP
jgi:chemotaxis signal transduction protein